MVSESKSACPVCGKPAQPQSLPFCSARCARVDLGRWLGEVYRVPGEEITPQAGVGDDEED